MSRKAWDHRKTSTERGYGKQHVKLRAQLLAREPMCRMCMAKTPPRYTAARIADHIVPLARGGAAHDITNLQPLCAECHRKKNALDKGHRYRPRIGVDGWPID